MRNNLNWMQSVLPPKMKGFWHIKFVVASILFLSSPAYAGVDGFRDLAFNMDYKTARDILDKKCKTPLDGVYGAVLKAVCYEVSGQARFTEVSFEPGGKGIASIVIYLDQYTKKSWEGLNGALGKKYRLDHEVTNKELKASDSRRENVVHNIYENGQVLASIARIKNAPIIAIQYRSPQSAGRFMATFKGETKASEF